MAQFASDTFTGTENTVLSTYNADWVLHGSATGNAQIASDRARQSTSTQTVIYYHTGTPASADYSVSADCFAKETDGGASATGVLGRVDTAANTYYAARYIGSATDGWQLTKFVTGTATQLGSTFAQSLTDETAYNVKLEMIGSTIKLYVDGVERISATDSSITAAGKSGIRFANGTAASDTTGIHLDNFSADDIGGGAIAGTTTTTFTNTGTLTGEGALAGVADLTFATSATIGGAGALSGSIDITFTDTATLLGAGILAGTSNLAFANTATLTGEGALAGVSALVFSNSGTLDAPAGELAGIISMTFANQGSLLGAGALTGAADLSFVPTATLFADAAMAGQSAMTFSLSGAMNTGGGVLSGSASMSFSLSATLRSGPLFGKIKFVKRGGAVAASIPEADLAAHEWGTDTPDQLDKNRNDDLELPIELDVNYINIGADYQMGTQRSQRMTGNGSGIQTISAPIVLNDAKGKRVADVNLFNLYNSRTTFKFQLSNKWARLEPTDPVDVTAKGVTYRVRLTKKDAGKPGLIKLEGVLEDSSIYTQSGAGAVPANIDEQTVAADVLTYAVLLDIPLLRDQDEGAGFYVAACGYQADWKGCVLFKSDDGGATYTALKTLTNPATIGSATSVLGDFTGGNMFDETNFVDVFLLNGTLSSATELAVLNGANTIVIGTEVLQFKTATLTATRRYRLSGLLRGRRGTEWAMSTHAVGDRVVLADTNAWRRVDAPTSEIGLARQYKAVSLGMTLQQTATINSTNNAVGLECYSVVELAAGVDGSRNATINWKRRGRLDGAWRDYIDVPLGETTESYEIEVWDSDFNTLKRTITASTQTASYTSAQQVTDFGINQAYLYLKDRQFSANVGRGYVNQQTLNIYHEYATLDTNKKAANITLSGGNLTCAQNAAGDGSVLSTFGKSGGNDYWEVLVNDATNDVYIGIAKVSANTALPLGWDGYGWGYWSNGRKINNSDAPLYGATYTTGDRIGIHLNNGTLTFYKNNVSQGVAFTGLTGVFYPAAGKNGTFNLTFNFGATALTYTPPAGAASGFSS